MNVLYEFLTQIDVNLDQLLIDPNNLRFADLSDADTQVPESRIAEERVQRDALERMKIKRFDVAELRDTIKSVGYLPIDRIVVRLWEGKAEGNQRYLVIEGNRRVAALKWLIELHETGRETFTDEEISNFTSVPALLLDADRAPDFSDLVIPGLRHVSGVKDWGPYQRARAVVALRETGESPREVAQSLGLSTQMANRLWRSSLALEQMRSDEEYGEFVEPRMFSFFDEIMRRPNIRNWLGWNDDNEGFANEEHLREIYGWMVGELEDGEEGETRTESKLPEAKSIRDLSRFIEDYDAVALFRSPGGTLSRSLSRHEAKQQQQWQSTIIAAEAMLASLSPDTLRKMSDDDLELIDELMNRLSTLHTDRKRLLA